MRYRVGLVPELCKGPPGRSAGGGANADPLLLRAAAHVGGAL